MTGLVLRLKPFEKVLVNGVLLQNGDRSAKIRVRSKDVSVLRTRDAIRPEEANTPLKRIYYIAQLALAGEASIEESRIQIISGLDAVESIFRGDAAEKVRRARQGALEGKFFVVMRAVNSLFDAEERLLSHGEASAQGETYENVG